MKLLAALCLLGCAAQAPVTREARFVGAEPPGQSSEQVFACAMHEGEFWCFPIEELIRRMDLAPRRSPSEQSL